MAVWWVDLLSVCILSFISKLLKNIAEDFEPFVCAIPVSVQ